MVVALDDATVRQDYLCSEQVIRGQPVLAAEDPEPTTEGETGDPDGGAAAGGDGEAVPVKRVASNLRVMRICSSFGSVTVAVPLLVTATVSFLLLQFL